MNYKRAKTKKVAEQIIDERLPTDWHRPALVDFNPKTTSIAMQQVETDYYIVEPEPGKSGQIHTNTSNNNSPISSMDDQDDDMGETSATRKYSSSGQREAVIRIFGVTEEGNSVVYHVHNFHSYMYVPAWDNITESSMKDFTQRLSERLRTDSREKGLENPILCVSPMEASSIWGFKDNKKSSFLKITFALPTLLASAKRFLDEGIYVEGDRKIFQTYESNIPYVLRYMVDHNCSGGSWLEAPPDTYTVRTLSEKDTTSQLEIDIDCSKIISHQPEGEWLKMAPMRVLSFDIECAGRKGVFPTPDIDPVIQIASCLSLSTNIQKPIHKVVHTLNTCASIPGSEIISRMTEREMLMAWKSHLIEADADIIVGYNIMNFDLPYLIDRAATLKLTEFPYLGRVKGYLTKVRNTTFANRAIGKQENKEVNMEGRVIFDVLVAIRREYKLVSYTLNAVSAEFLKQQKEDVHHSIITDLQNGTDDTRRRLAEYCLKDALLPLRLMHKLMLLVNYIEMARVTGVPIVFLLNRGQSIKVVSQILRKAKEHNMLVPNVKKGISDDKFDGATVLEPNKGYYRDPIATLDFSSLYPSIMMAHNLCYTTLLSPAEALKMDPADYTKTPTNDYFVKPHKCKGLLPEILDEIIKARKLARKEMAQATDPFTKAVLNGRQLALKISANSVYGFTGAQVGQLPCLQISSSVTGFGRVMIEHTRDVVQKQYTKENGYEYDCEVIYGDTDSVMIKFGTPDIKEAMRLGQEAAELVSKEFISPIKLEFEKVYWPYLLMNKKRYAGLYWTNPDKWDKIDTKGIETVRRDNCTLVKNVVTEALDTILVHRSPEQAIEDVKRYISDLLCNKLDLSLLVISKSLGKGANSSDYAAKQAHVELAERMRKRDPASAPNTGDRVPYVIIKGAKGAANYEKSEDPIYVLEHDIPIDTDYYLEQQLRKPLERIFEPIMGADKVSELFNGDHTRKIKVTTAKSTGGVLKFAQKADTCLGCRVVLPTGRRVLCIRCEPRRSELLIEKMEDVRLHEHTYSKLWSQCQRCQASMHQEVLCTSRDCPIFYKRKKVQLDLNEANGIVDKFSMD